MNVLSLLLGVVVLHAGVLPGTSFAFSVNEQVQVSFDCGANLRLRSGAGLSGSVLASMPVGTALTVVSGSSVCSDGYLWWNVRRRSDGLTGWSAVAEWLTPHPSIGRTVQVGNLCGQRLNLRDNPGVAGTNVITTIAEGTPMTVIGGPTCADGGAEATQIEWWQIEGFVDGVFRRGWSAAGYWLETLCGNGSLNAGEVCDGDSLNGATCTSQGFPSGGPLACSSSCTAFDTSGCFVCGNGIRQGNEQCDGSDLSGCTAGQTCTSSCTCQGSGDADGDGIPNGSDSCPSTPAGQVVDSQGCSCTQKTCNDSNLCTTDSCNPSTAQCLFTSNANPCNDGNACTLGDTCSGGSCTPGTFTSCLPDGTVNCSEQCDPTASPSGCGSGQGCSASCTCVSLGCTDSSQCTGLADQCNNGVCNLSSQLCERQPKSAGTLCNDGNPCTINDQCSGGTCTGGPHCGNGTIEAGCNEQCDGSPVGCSSGQTCNSSCACVGGSGGCINDQQCEDGNACTIHRCVSGSCQLVRRAAKGIEGPAGDPTCSNGIDDDCNGLADTIGLPTGQGREPRCFGGVEVVDPFVGRSLVSPEGRLITDPKLLATGGLAVPSATIATDGTSRILLRANVPEAGTVTFDLSPSIVDTPQTVGFLTAIDDPSPTHSTSIREFTAEVVQTAHGFTAHAQYIAPVTFKRVSPDTSDFERTITVRARFYPRTPGATVEYQAQFHLVRPPVILLHGLWGSASHWTELLEHFFPSTASSASERFCHGPDFTGASPSPWFFCTPDYHNIANQKLYRGAALLAKTLDDVLDAYRKREHERGRHLIVSQVDIIGHSMGGLVARALAMCEDIPGLFADCAREASAQGHPYRRSANFFRGGIRRLISIGTPHLGSPLAARLRDALSENLACVVRSCPPAYAGLFCPFPQQTEFPLRTLMMSLNMPPGPALDDLAGELAALDGSGSLKENLSGALFALLAASHYGLPTHTIGGDADTLRDWACGTAGVFALKTFCPGVWTGSTITNLLGPSNDLIVPLDSQLFLRADGESASSLAPLVHSSSAARCPSGSPAEPAAPSVWDTVRRLLEADQTEFAKLP